MLKYFKLTFLDVCLAKNKISMFPDYIKITQFLCVFIVRFIKNVIFQIVYFCLYYLSNIRFWQLATMYYQGYWSLIAYWLLSLHFYYHSYLNNAQKKCFESDKYCHWLLYISIHTKHKHTYFVINGSTVNIVYASHTVYSTPNPYRVVCSRPKLWYQINKYNFGFILTDYLN